MCSVLMWLLRAVVVCTGAVSGVCASLAILLDAATAGHWQWLVWDGVLLCGQMLLLGFCCLYGWQLLVAAVGVADDPYDRMPKEEVEKILGF